MCDKRRKIPGTCVARMLSRVNADGVIGQAQHSTYNEFEGSEAISRSSCHFVMATVVACEWTRVIEPVPVNQTRDERAVTCTNRSPAHLNI